MDCQEATLLISARIDGDLASDRSTALDAHLAECEICRLALSDMELQDAALMRAFLPCQEAAVALATRVAQNISREATARSSAGMSRFVSKSLMRVAGWATAAAAGFLAATIIMRPASPRLAGVQHKPSAAIDPVARLTLATGEVFTCPTAETVWRPVSPSDPIELLSGIRTANAKCELRLPDGSCIQLNSGTEAQFTSGRTVSVSSGELWSALPRDAAPICVSAGQTSVRAGGSGNDQGAQFDVARSADAATVTVQVGAADVVGNGPATTVRAGQALRPPSPGALAACEVAPELPQASSWRDDLLVLKPGDDPEVVARVDQLLGCISTDLKTIDGPGAVEQDVRARGQAWCTPFACYIRDRPSGIETRRTAARLLADLAPPSRIPDLIDLLTDGDGQVRYYASAALRRLTGQTLGHPPERCAATLDIAAASAWHEWWKENEARYRKGTPGR